jgi:hypothetical protein
MAMAQIMKYILQTISRFVTEEDIMEDLDDINVHWLRKSKSRFFTLPLI